MFKDLAKDFPTTFKIKKADVEFANSIFTSLEINSEEENQRLLNSCNLADLNFNYVTIDKLGYRFETDPFDVERGAKCNFKNEVKAKVFNNTFAKYFNNLSEFKFRLSS